MSKLHFKRPHSLNKPSQENRLRELFRNNADIIFRDVHYFFHETTIPIQLIYCQGMIDQKALDKDISETINKFFSNLPIQPITRQIIEEHLNFTSLKYLESSSDITTDVYNGFVYIYFKKEDLLFGVNIAEKPNRKTEDTNMEVSILGSRDNFIEDIIINMALIRKRLPTNSLCSKDFFVGKRSKRRVKVLYIEDITDKHIVEKISIEIEKLDIDVLLSGNQFMDLIGKPSRLFPKYDYSGRPDYAVQSLLTGRVVIMIDSIPYVIITPVNLFLLFKSSEDNEYPVLYNSVERLVRFMGLLTAIFLPGFWIAITSFHQNQLPLSLLATVVESRRGIPLPTQLEGILMLVIFELFREAGLRLPMAIGQTLSVVGGLIIGDAAIRAGITSPSMLVVIAGSVVSGFTIVNQSLIGAVSILRFFVLILSSFIGFFGFFISVFCVITYLANIRIFGIPYLLIATRFDFKTLFTAILRIPWKKYTDRAAAFDTPDRKRKEE